MIGMKKLILISFLILALFGCTKTAEKSLIDNQMALNQTIEANNLSADNLITVTGDENIAKIEIKSSNLQFPLKKYEKQFVNVGLHSEAFIKLDKSHIAFLDDNEAIWLTPMIRNNSGVLFNAIYSKDVDSCKSAYISILGKSYNLGSLKNASSFRGDDKWKILFDYNGTYCIKRLIIYMDGYFYNLKEGEQINLFRNDNTMVLSFQLEEEQKIKITAVKPVEEIKKKEETKGPSSDIIQDDSGGKTYNKKELVNESGLFLEFDPVIPTCTDKNCSREEYLTELHQVRLNINDKDLVITKFGKDDVTLAKEQNSAFLNRYNCAVEQDNTIKVGDKTFVVEEFYNRHNEPKNAIAVFYSLDNSTRIELSAGETKKVNSEYLHVWYFGFDYTFCADWVGVSSLSEIINLLEDKNTVLTWENENSSNPALRSIFIPRSSPIFKKLIGNKKELTDKEILDYAKTSFNQSEMMFKDFILGYHNGIPVRAWFPCSDICPDYTTKIIHYNVSINQCKEIGGSIAIIYVPVGIASSREEFCVPTVLTDNQVYPEKD